MLEDHESAYAFVTMQSKLDLFKAHSEGVRDVDLLEENLGIFEWNATKFAISPYPFIYFVGSISIPYYLSSNEYIPERITSQIDGKTSLMIENGLHNFYESHAAFLRKLRTRTLDNDEEKDLRALTMFELREPLTLLFGMMIFALVMVVIEIGIYKLNQLLCLIEALITN